MRAVDSAANRFFRDYDAYCVTPNEDALFHLLNSFHSFHDKFHKETGHDLFASPYFQALKALRNFFHHHAELAHRLKVLVPSTDLPLTMDLLTLCLVDRELTVQALDEDAAKTKRTVEERGEIAESFKWYGDVVNVQPCIFNAAVDVFEAVRAAGLQPKSGAFERFEESYMREAENGFSHYVTGEIACHAGNVETLLRQLLPP